MELYFNCAGGSKGDKDGFTIPAGTDIFLSVSGSIHISVSPLANTDVETSVREPGILTLPEGYSNTDPPIHTQTQTHL